MLFAVHASIIVWYNVVPYISVLSFDLSKDVAVDLSVDVADRCNQLAVADVIAISNKLWLMANGPLNCTVCHRRK